MRILVVLVLALSGCGAHTLTVSGTNTFTPDSAVQPGVTATYSAKPAYITAAYDPWFGAYATVGVTYTIKVKEDK